MAIHRIGPVRGVLSDLPPGPRQTATVAELNERAREVLRHVVEGYVETGEPVGSRALTRKLTETLSPATIRNIMADLQDLGLLYAPHTSAGRLPTDAGLRLFVNGLLEVGNLSEDERESIEARCAHRRPQRHRGAGAGDHACCPACRAAPASSWRPRPSSR